MGKSTLLTKRFPGSARFDLLDTRILIQFTREPWIFAEQVLALPEDQRHRPIIVDEAQKVPAILDESQRLIENEGLSFVLCGSSARKLKRGGGNLLGGRAWRFHLHPLIWRELPDFDLLRALSRGLVPAHYNSTQELLAYRSYRETDFPIRYWRTKSGLEVDFVLGPAGDVAVEVKGARVRREDLRGIRAFVEEHQPAHAVVVCGEAAARRLGPVEVLPWKVFLERLWDGALI